MTRSITGQLVRLGAALLALIAAIVIVRTLTFGGSSPDYSDIALPEPPAIDVQQAADALGDAIRIKTITLQAGDPAEGQEGPWLELRDYIEARYPTLLGAADREIVARHTLLYTWAGRDRALPPLVLMAHQDVVPVNLGTIGDWTYPPFEGRVADGYIWGRGALDDKGGLIGLLEAGDALAKSGWTPARDIIFFFGHDEEVSGAGAQAAFAHLKAKGVDPVMVLDEGFLALKDFPLTGAPAAVIGVAEKGYATYRITAETAGGHSSTPPPESGAVRIARAIVALEDNQFPAELNAPPFPQMVEAVAADLPFATRLALANQWLFGGVVKGLLRGDGASNAIIRTTTAPTMMAGSIKENVLPQRATAIVNFRIHPSNTPDDVRAHIEARTAHIAGLTVEPVEGGIVSPPSPVSSTQSDAYKKLAAVASAAADGAPVVPALVLGATDARYATAISDDAVYRFYPAFVSVADSRGFHGTDEKLSVENIGRMARGYAQIMMLVAGE